MLAIVASRRGALFFGGGPKRGLSAKELTNHDDAWVISHWIDRIQRAP
jgi:hypothetical protein